MRDTTAEYNQAIKQCKELFLKKAKDYGTAWRILRLSSITDQLFIKAQRIRTLEVTGVAKVDEGIPSEFIAIVNYCVIALLQIELGEGNNEEINLKQLEESYDKKVSEAYNLMMAKNHDYGEAWRDMRISSLTDLILMKILRVKQIEDNKGETLASEGTYANYQDMLNYAVFALIRLQPTSQS
ncbi:DUF1599 domain-containing protein [Albibacterium sp.]|uniref:DUF1599 domain-containing protein n=1 Tax=Albibacterium sp. TaxID=2952885 RepID=UPI002B51B958|nr:DUF1599 domain-containing protein [Albibacterium sp.]HUH20131.1 DUF1599 domain-containing protein [Albibacterium sp.]